VLDHTHHIRQFNSHQDEIQPTRSSPKHTSIDKVGFIDYCNNFKMAAVTSFSAQATPAKQIGSRVR